MVTLAIFAPWSRFTSERYFYRYPSDHLRAAFPTLPDRSQFNRRERGTGGLGAVRARRKGFEGVKTTTEGGSFAMGPSLSLPTQTQRPQGMVQALLRRWVAGIRQIVETVYDKLFNAFGLWRERPHQLKGLRAQLAARAALHNFFCIWLNVQLGRPRLAFADLLGW